jgi:hypothetical protein
MGQKIKTKEVCPGCGSEYKSLGGHWSKSSCSPPELTDRQKSLIEGSILGDGSFTGYNYRQFTLSMTNRQFLEWFNDQFGILTTGVKRVMTAEQSAKMSPNGNNNPDDHLEVFSVKFRTADEIANLYHKWYPSKGNKQIRDDFLLDKYSLKMWFVQDGRWWSPDDHDIGRIEIAHSFDPERVNGLFSNIGIDIDRHETSSHVGEKRHYSEVFNAKSAKSFWDYIGKPAPGFEYKWHPDYM